MHVVCPAPKAVLRAVRAVKPCDPFALSKGFPYLCAVGRRQPLSDLYLFFNQQIVTVADLRWMPGQVAPGLLTGVKE
uniref:Uncharacterized protein n=1 Tax=Siphoviridae sp. ctBLh2 TaxID=2827803 RepID=A0A8S5S3I4_9CAUD|nr:MAG TPA: hypothetical protein [Siphoviridae sp. ctBLh2]